MKDKLVMNNSDTIKIILIYLCLKRKQKIYLLTFKVYLIYLKISFSGVRKKKGARAPIIVGHNTKGELSHKLL